MSEEIVRDISAPLFGAKGWMKFLGVMYIISGVLTALSIIGIIVAWIPIWMGVLLFQGASAIEQANASGDENLLKTGLGKVKTFFVINGVLMLVVLAFYALMLIFGIGAGIMGMHGMSGMQ